MITYIGNMFNQAGYLEPGLQSWKLRDIRERLVDGFAASTTRPNILKGFLTFRAQIHKLSIPGHQILDGSFCTNKENPNDIDVVTFMDFESINGLSPENQQALMQLTTNNGSKDIYKTDSYFCWSARQDSSMYPKYLERRRYWLGQFGFDRDEVPKGLIVLDLSPEAEETDSAELLSEAKNAADGN